MNFLCVMSLILAPVAIYITARLVMYAYFSEKWAYNNRMIDSLKKEEKPRDHASQ